MNRNITALILIVLAVGIYFTFTQGQIDDAKKQNEVNKQYLSAIENAKQLISVRDKVLNEYNNLSDDDKTRLDKMLPSTVDNIRLIIDLNSVALRHGFSLRNIKTTAPQSSASSNTAKDTSTGSQSKANTPPKGGIATPTLDSVNVTFNVTAPYDQFILFLRDLEADLRIIDLTHLTLASNQSGSYDFTVEMKTYWLRQ